MIIILAFLSILKKYPLVFYLVCSVIVRVPFSRWIITVKQEIVGALTAAAHSLVK